MDNKFEKKKAILYKVKVTIEGSEYSTIEEIDAQDEEEAIEKIKIRHVERLIANRIFEIEK